VLLGRSLAEPLSAFQLPDDYSVVTLAESPESTCGIPGSGLTQDLYRPIQQASGCKADLDVRAFYHDTLLASGCTCWYDEVDHCGEFQPVGTKGGHRRKGLASAVLTSAMENLRRYRADRVLVWTDRSFDRGPTSTRLGTARRSRCTCANSDRAAMRRSGWWRPSRSRIAPGGPNRGGRSARCLPK
jgi:hypothetical protein